MTRTILTVLSVILIAAGLLLFALGLRGFLAAVSPGGDVTAVQGGVMPQEVGFYAPPTLWIGAGLAALGIILFTFRKDY